MTSLGPHEDGTRLASRPQVRPRPLPSLLLTQPSVLHEVFFYVADAHFCWIWTALLLSYAFVATMLALFAGVYVSLLLSPQSQYYAEMFRTISIDAFPFVALAYASMALLYVWQIVRLVGASLRRRQLCFPLGLYHTAKETTRSEQSNSALPTSRASRCSRAVRRMYRLVFSSRGILGVRGRFFDTVTLLREVVEVAVQVVQAYSCSFSTADVGTNVTFGALLVLNCFASPLLHRHGRASSSGVRRLVVLVLDLVLDIFWSIVLPFSFLVPYVAHIGNPEAVYYQDTFVAKALMELPMIIVTSPADLFVKLIPTTSLLFTLRKFELLIQRKSYVAAAVAAAASPNRDGSQLKRQLSSFSSMLVTSSGLLRHLQAATLLLWVMLATGSVVLAANVLAFLVYDPQCPDGCKLKVSPWFVVDASRCECAVLEINCYAHGIDGAAADLHDVLVRVEPDTLLALIITHCRALEVPRSLHRFTNLFSLEIFNSSIRTWPIEAAITQHALPRFGYLLLVYTFLLELPAGVYHASLPASLREVDIVVSNLTTLPDDLHDTWPNVRTLYIDLAQLTEFPPVLSKMTQLETLSLRGNAIRSVPRDALAPLRLRYLMLSENLLTTVPTEVLLGPNSTLKQLQIVGTPIASLQSSDTATVSGNTKTIFARRSPLCESQDSVPAPAGWRVECARAYTTYRGVPSVGYYPLEGKLAERRPRG